MRFESGSQTRHFPAAVLGLTAILLSNAVWAQEPAEPEKAQILYRVRILEVPTAEIEDTIADWRILGSSQSNTKSSDDVQQASFAPNTRSFEIVASDALTAAAFSQIVDVGKTLSTPNLLAESGNQASARVGSTIPFVTGFEKKKGDSDEDSTELQAKIAYFDAGISVSMTGELDEEDDSILLAFSYKDTEFISLDKFTFDSPDGPLTIDQPAFSSSEIENTLRVELGETYAICGTEEREFQVERKVPVVSAVPYVGRLFKNTAVGRERISTVILIRCELARPGQTFHNKVEKPDEQELNNSSKG